jgi:hypothetical protein
MIGAFVGFIVLLITIMTFQAWIWGLNRFLVAFGWVLISDSIVSLLGIPFGIIGALIGNSWLKTMQVTWIGSFIGIILVVIALFVFRFIWIFLFLLVVV